MKNKILLQSLILVSFVSAAGCSKSQTGAQNAAPAKPEPVFSNPSVEEKGGATQPSANPDVAATAALKASVTVSKKTILSQSFFYGADLQYSSDFNEDMDLYNQSIAVGHIPANFRIAGSELQLVADKRYKFPSDINHPEELLSRFKILAETDDTLTISSANSGVSLVKIYDEKGGAAPADLWVRSFEIAENGTLLLQETSIITPDGKVVEFMESVMPQNQLKAGADFEKLEMDPENPVGGDTEFFERFRLILAEAMFDGETKLGYGAHFDISRKADGSLATIDWYVTRNIPDEFIEPVKTAIEGWNRYFRAMKGIERDVVLFKGKLPEGTRLGDPRYNVINWDSRRVAGAAYESQATDPFTGKQSHSLIYMPAAWVQIGMEYWARGQFSDPAKVTARLKNSLLARLGKMSCARDVREAAELLASGRVHKDDLKTFGMKLLKQTLFHEVGHALGLAHNFKGSLAYDRTKPGGLVSDSIMDYNDYELEREAFHDVHSSDGPLLPYDRQIISALYNKQTDIAESDPVLPVCNDDEADNEIGGVDPLCIRYDVEKDPTKSTVTAWDRIQEAAIEGDFTLAQAIGRVQDIILKPEAIDAVKTQADLLKIVKQTGTSLKGPLIFYTLSAPTSLSKTTRSNIKSLMMFADGVLPKEYSEAEMRERAFTAVQRSVSLMAYPAVITDALATAQANALKAIEKTPFIQSLTSEAQAELLEKVRKAIENSVKAFSKDESSGLPRLRAAVLGALARHKDVPFYFGKLGEESVQRDYETAIVTILVDAVAAKTRAPSERLTAAQSLASFAGRSIGDAALKGLIPILNEERATTTDNKSRELIERIYKILGGK